MKAGKLDRTIVIEAETRAPNAYGKETVQSTKVAVLRAQLIQASTEEFLRDFGRSSEKAVIFRTRFVAGITTKHRVIYEGHAHDLVEVKELGRRRGLELRTVARGVE